MDDSKADLTLVVQDGDEEWFLPVRRAVLELTSELVAGLPDEEGDEEMPVIGHGAASVVRFLRLCYPNIDQPIDSDLVFKVTQVASWFQAPRIIGMFVEHVKIQLMDTNENIAVDAALQLQSIGKKITLPDYAIAEILRSFDNDDSNQIASIIRVPVITQCIDYCKDKTDGQYRQYRRLCENADYQLRCMGISSSYQAGIDTQTQTLSQLVSLAKHLLQFHPRQ